MSVETPAAAPPAVARLLTAWHRVECWLAVACFSFIAIILVLACLGGAAVVIAAGGAWFFLGREAPPSGSPEQPGVEAQDPEPRPEPQEQPKAPPEDTGQRKGKSANAENAPSGAEPSAQDAPAGARGGAPASAPAQPSSTRSSGAASAGTSRSGTPSAPKPSAGAGSRSTTSPTAPPAPDEVATGGKYTVRFMAQGHEAQLTCGDGQQASFVSSTQLEFEGVVTCMVQIEAARGAVQVRKAQTVTCSIAGSQVSCGGS